MRNARLICALRHVALARKSLSLAASDLAVMRYRGALPASENGDELTLELERVCELARELERCAAKLDDVAGDADIREMARAAAVRDATLTRGRARASA